MKDTIITAALKRRELKILLCCFIVAMLVNIGAIIWFNTEWLEILSQIGYVVCLTAILYVIVWGFRALFCLFKRRK